MDEQQRALRDEIAGLRARLSAIESQLSGGVGAAEAEPTAATGAQPDQGPPQVDTPVADAPRTTDRRSALKLAGAAAAGLAGGAVVATAAPAAAADGNNFVLGQANSATNDTRLNTSSTFGLVVAQSTDGAIAIQADGFGVGLGILGRAATGTGVSGDTNTGTALRGRVNAPGGTALRLNGNGGPSIKFVTGATVPPASRTWEAGDVVGSPLGLWFCYLAGVGPASKWVKMSSALVTLPVPVRVYDSRPGQAPLAIGPKTKLVAATPRTIDCKGNSSGVPTGASSVLLNLVVTGTTTGDSGYLAVYKAGVPFPNTSNLNWSAAGQNVAVTTVSAVDAQSQVNIWAASATDVVIDVIGFYP